MTLHGDHVFQVTRKRSNRDYYRIGIGINVVDLIKALSTKDKKK